MSAPGDAPPRTSKLDFAAVLASSVHDLKNSVGMLLNALSDVATDLPPGQGELRDRFNQLQYETMRVSGDLIQLLAVYKIDHGRYALNLAHHDVADFLDESLLQYDPLLQRRGISMRVECPQGLRWFFDSHLVAGVINNVIHNASRYTRDMLLVRARGPEPGDRGQRPRLSAGHAHRATGRRQRRGFHRRQHRARPVFRYSGGRAAP